MNNFKHLKNNDARTSSFLELLEKIVIEVIEIIKQSSKIEDVRHYFQLLDMIQFCLAKYVFKDKQQVSQFLRNFIYYFDRLDDKEWREELYARIKNGN